MRNRLIGDASIDARTPVSFGLLLALMVGIVGCQPAPEPEASANPDVSSVAAAAETLPSDTSTAPPPDSAPCELTMGWDPWEPYHFAAAGGRPQGLDIELVLALGERVGCRFEFVQGNWASLLRLLQVGELDVLAGASITPERERFARFSDTYREERFVLFVRKEERERWQDRSLGDLLESGFRLGITQGYQYPDVIQSLQMNDNVAQQFLESAIGELNLNALMDYKIDGFIEDPYVVAAIQRRSRAAGEIEALDLDFGMHDVHLLFSRQSVSEQQVQAFNDALQQSIDDGSHEALLERYLN